MKQFWLGVALLILFLGLGLWVTDAMRDTHEPVAAKLAQAAEQALAGDLQGGSQLAEEANAQWQSGWRGTAALADHGPMEEIDSLFAQLQIYAQADRPVDFAAYCMRLSAMIRAIGEAYGAGWWNLL